MGQSCHWHLRTKLTTCAMRYPIAHRPLTCPQNEERTKNQLHDGLYHNILCMSIWIEHDFVYSDNQRQYEPRLRRTKFYGTGGRGEPREPPPGFPCFALHRAFYKREMPSVCTLKNADGELPGPYLCSGSHTGAADSVHLRACR